MILTRFKLGIKEVDRSLGQDTSKGLRTGSDTLGATEDNQLHPTPGLHRPTQAYLVFDRSRNQYILNCLHLVSLFTGVSVLYCGRAMQVGIIGGAALGHRVSVPAGPVWSRPALGALSPVLAVVAVCTGVFANGLLIPITLFCYVRWLC